MAQDFKKLLSVPATSIEKPKPLPIGTYDGVIHSHSLGESRENKTPYVRLAIRPLVAGPDVDVEALAAAGGSERFPKVNCTFDFWLTEDSLYRLTEFFTNVLGVDIEGKTLDELIGTELNNKPVKFELQHRFGQDGETTYMNVTKLLKAD